MPKINRAGVSYEPGREPDGPLQHPGHGEPVTAVEHPADGTMSPPADNGGGPVRAAVTVVPAPEPEAPPAAAAAPKSARQAPTLSRAAKKDGADA